FKPYTADIEQHTLRVLRLLDHGLEHQFTYWWCAVVIQHGDLLGHTREIAGSEEVTQGCSCAGRVSVRRTGLRYNIIDVDNAEVDAEACAAGSIGYGGVHLGTRKYDDPAHLHNQPNLGVKLQWLFGMWLLARVGFDMLCC